jgi:hypothetical protein
MYCASVKACSRCSLVICDQSLSGGVVGTGGPATTTSESVSIGMRWTITAATDSEPCLRPARAVNVVTRPWSPTDPCRSQQRYLSGPPVCLPCQENLGTGWRWLVGASITSASREAGPRAPERSSAASRSGRATSLANFESMEAEALVIPWVGDGFSPFSRMECPGLTTRTTSTRRSGSYGTREEPHDSTTCPVVRRQPRRPDPL